MGGTKQSWMRIDILKDILPPTSSKQHLSYSTPTHTIFTPAGPAVAGRLALVVPTSKFAPADLLTRRAAAITAPAFARVTPAGPHLVTAPFAGQLCMAEDLLLHLATPVGVE